MFNTTDLTPYAALENCVKNAQKDVGRIDEDISHMEAQISDLRAKKREILIQIEQFRGAMFVLSPVPPVVTIEEAA